MLEFLALSVYVRDFSKSLTQTQKNMFAIEYSKINQIPTEIKKQLKLKVLFDNSPVMKIYTKCGITDFSDMIDNFLRILYLYINYEYDEEENNELILFL